MLRLTVDALNMVSNSLANTKTTTAVATGAGVVAGVQIQAKMVADADALKNVHDGVKGLGETLPALIKGLEEVSRLHPFIAGKTFLLQIGVC